MHATTHLENANFLRELAESLPRINPKASTPRHIALLQRLANEELAEAEYTEMVRAKVAASRANPGTRMTTNELRGHLQARYEQLRDDA